MRREIQAVIVRLKEIKLKVEGYAENAAEERADELESELEAIEAAIESLKEIG